MPSQECSGGISVSVETEGHQVIVFLHPHITVPSSCSPPPVELTGIPQGPTGIKQDGVRTCAE